MAQPIDDSASGVTPTSVRCPRCGAQVTAEPSHAGDKGVLFQCPTCGKMFGIVPGIPNEEQESSTPSPSVGEILADDFDRSGATETRPDPDGGDGHDVAGHGVAVPPSHPG